jgi:AcrR family transcriptional regulator
MTEISERRADSTRQRLIAAASRQFAHHPYSMVSLDDILAEAELTKGAMYFHFASKQALAVAIIDDLTEMSRAAVTELVARKMSGLETVIDLVYLLAVQDTQNEVARAGVRLLDTLDNTALATTLWQSWVETVTTLIQKAVKEGDDDPKTSQKCWWRCGWVSGESATSTNPSITSITSKKHGYWHYPALPIPTGSTTSPNSSNDATHLP